jgi:hypothetical protein
LVTQYLAYCRIEGNQGANIAATVSGELLLRAELHDLRGCLGRRDVSGVT